MASILINAKVSVPYNGKMDPSIQENSPAGNFMVMEITHGLMASAIEVIGKMGYVTDLALQPGHQELNTRETISKTRKMGLGQ